MCLGEEGEGRVRAVHAGRSTQHPQCSGGQDKARNVPFHKQYEAKSAASVLTGMPMPGLQKQEI